MPPRDDRPPEALLRPEPLPIPADTTPTGFPSVDRALGGGLRGGDLTILMGDVGVGKSALALGIALRAAARGAVTYASGEMAPDRLRERSVALEARIPVDDLRVGAGAGNAAVADARARLDQLPLTFVPLLGDGFEELERLARAPRRPSLLVVDALQHVTPPRAAARADDRAAQAARALKALALQTGLPLLVLAHLPAFRAGRPDPRPTLDDLGARGAVKQHADVVLGLFREEMYRPGSEVEGATELLVLKHRNGPTTMVDLYFYKRWLRVEDMLD